MTSLAEELPLFCSNDLGSGGRTERGKKSSAGLVGYHSKLELMALSLPQKDYEAYMVKSAKDLRIFNFS